jgi:U3 small nucleolar RNA-associated protein 4
MEEQSSVHVHQARFLKYSPSAIVALQFTPTHSDAMFLTIARQSGELELWDPIANWTCVATFPGDETRTIQSIVWICDEETRQLRLFSAGLTGYVVEHHLPSLVPKAKLDACGGPVWSITADRAGKRLVAGCEDGSIRLIDVADGAFEYVKAFEPSKHRILSLVWDTVRDVVYSSSSDGTIKRWDAASGRVLERMSLGKIKKSAIVVWTLAALSENIVASGDSNGHVVIWETDKASVRERFDTHHADVLCLAASGDGKVLYSSGVDRSIQRYDLETLADGEGTLITSRYMATLKSQVHDHDIKAMAVCEHANVHALVSGGMDRTVRVSDHDHFPTMRPLHLSFAPLAPIAHVASDKRLVLARERSNRLLLWHFEPLPMANEYTHQQAAPKPRLVTELHVGSKREEFSCSAMSANGQYVFAGMANASKLYQLEQMVNGKHRVTKVEGFPSVGARLAEITTNHVILATFDARILVIHLNGSIAAEFTDHTKDRHAAIRAMSVSPDGHWLVSNDSGNHTFVYNLQTLELAAALPQFSSRVTRVSISSDNQHAFILLASHHVHMYSLAQQTLTDFSRQLYPLTPTSFLTLKDGLLGIAMDPNQTTRFLVYGSRSLVQIRMDKLPVFLQPMKKRTIHGDTAEKRHKKREQYRAEEHDHQQLERETCQGQFSINHGISALLWCGFIAPDELVVLTRPYYDMAGELQPAFYKKKYGI